MAAGAVATSLQTGAAFKRRPGLPAWLVLAPLLAWLILFVIVPTIMLVVLSLGEQKGLGTIHFTFTLKNYARAFDWTWLKVLLISVRVCPVDHHYLHDHRLPCGVLHRALALKECATSCSLS